MGISRTKETATIFTNDRGKLVFAINERAGQGANSHCLRCHIHASSRKNGRIQYGAGVKMGFSVLDLLMARAISSYNASRHAKDGRRG